MNRWYAVYTQPRSESKAFHHLGLQGFKTYYPRYLKVRRHARRVERYASPLFPRYLFVSLDIERERWRAIGSTRGVGHLVCQGERPAPVPDDIIDAIVAREDISGLIALDERRSFTAGERVELVEGPLAERFGIFECAADSERVVILLNLLGRPVRVALPRESLRACA